MVHQDSIRYMQHDAVEGTRRDQLTAQAAAASPGRGDDIEHGVFHIIHRWASGEPGFVDVDVAGGARKTTTALPSHAGDAVHLGRIHQVAVFVDIVADAFTIGQNPVHFRHGVLSFKVEKQGGLIQPITKNGL